MIDSETAWAWREREGYVQRGGVVIVFDGVAQGWMNQLRNPERWRPGCVAVDEYGASWIASGGDDDHGAAWWLPR